VDHGVLLLLAEREPVFLLLELIFNSVHLPHDLVLFLGGQAQPEVGQSLIMLENRKLRFCKEETGLFFIESA